MKSSYFILLVRSSLLVLFLTIYGGCNDEDDGSLLDECQGTSINEDVYLQSQKEVDSFGKLGVVRNSKAIFILGGQGQGDITNLDALSCLKSANSLLIVATGIEDLNGLNNLYFVGKLHLQGNGSLKDLGALESLRELGSLLLTENNSLEALNLPQDLYSPNNYHSPSSKYRLRTLEIRDSSLRNLRGLESWKEIQELRLIGNNALEDLKGLENLEKIERLDILQNIKLKNLNGLNGLTVVRNMRIEQNASLVSSDGLDRINRIYRFTIGVNDNLSDFCTLEDMINNARYQSFSFYGNLYNPTAEDFSEGRCRN